MKFAFIALYHFEGIRVRVSHKHHHISSEEVGDVDDADEGSVRKCEACFLKYLSCCTFDYSFALFYMTSGAVVVSAHLSLGLTKLYEKQFVLVSDEAEGTGDGLVAKWHFEKSIFLDFNE